MIYKRIYYVSSPLEFLPLIKLSGFFRKIFGEPIVKVELRKEFA